MSITETRGIHRKRSRLSVDKLHRIWGHGVTGQIWSYHV